MRTCPYCEDEIDAVRAAHPSHCDAPACRQSHAAMVAKRRLEAEEAEKERLRNSVRDLVQDQLDAVDAADLKIALVPFQAEPLRPLPAYRREMFTAFLDEALEMAFQSWPPEKDLAPWDNKPADEPAIVDAACGTCRGKCCRFGANSHAFLSAEFFQFLHLNDPTLTADTLTEYYLSHIPDQSVDGSCVFHGPMGCTLDRDMRSDVCNDFICTALAELSAGWVGGEPAVLVGEARGKAGAMTSIDRDGQTRAIDKLGELGRPSDA
ncbi:MAG: hypothetical protein AAF667_05045 [Pseudomonadota bacterium]